MRETFLAQMNRLQEDVLALGDLVGRALTQSIDQLGARDFAGSRELIAQDRSVNQKRFGIEADCLTLIATQQPLARDLRTIAALLEIVTELERMSDYAKGIAKINLLIGDAPLLKPQVELGQMATVARDMLRRALQAFAARDEAAARAIAAEDDVLDELYNQFFRELIAIIVADPTVADRANYLLWAAHNLERAGDRVTNICERVVFTVTGELMEIEGDSEELSASQLN